MKYPVFLLLASLCLQTQLTYGQLTLENCQAKARENFPLINQYDLIEQSKEYTLSNAKKSYLPQFDVTLIGGVIEGLPSLAPPGAEPSSGPEFNMISILQLNQTIWDGGITKAKKGIIEANSEIEQADLEVSLFQLQDRVNNLYFGILLIDEQAKQLEILKSTLQRNQKRVQIAVENGTAFKSDVDELIVEIINTNQKMEELSSTRQAYMSVLSAMIGEAISAGTVLERPALEENFTTLDNNRPELIRFQNQEYLIESQRKIEKAMLVPKFGLLGFGTFIRPGVDFGTSNLTNIFVGGISINWSLGGIYKNGNDKKLNALNLQKVQVQRETFLFNNKLELSQTRVELNKFRNLIEQDKEILRLKSKIKDAYDVKYENGICTMSELMDRTNDESVARQRLITHEVQYLMKAYQYKNKTGN